MKEKGVEIDTAVLRMYMDSLFRSIFSACYICDIPNTASCSSRPQISQMEVGIETTRARVTDSPHYTAAYALYLTFCFILLLSL